MKTQSAESLQRSAQYLSILRSVCVNLMGETLISNSKATGLKRFWFATKYSCQGLVATYKNEPAFRYECFAALFLVPLALLLGDSLTERAVLIGAVLFVMLVELINSALEAVVDRIGSDHNELSGRAKDQGSAAVLIALLIALLAWCAVLFD